MRFLEDIFLSWCSLRSPFSRVGVIPTSVLSSRQFLRYVKAALAALFLLLTYSGVSAAQTQYTIWPSTAVPGNLDVGPDSPVELGISFKSDVNGYITGIRFYKGSNNTGTHVGNLWSSTGTLLGSATFTNGTASGWQQVNFSTPVAITANTIYRASYHSTIGHYSVSSNYFTSSGADNAPLHAIRNTASTPNGPYCYGASSCFPANTYSSTNYWVDVAFTPGSTGTSGNGGSSNYTLWPSTAVPSQIDAGADSAVELGVTFRANSSGYITGVRFYKSSLNTGTHVGNLWSSAGGLLASATFANETTSGWQQVNFSTPVAITANANYVASYHTNAAHLSVNPSYFATSGVSNGPLSAPVNGNGSGNGVYRYGSGSGFPTYTYNSSNYWVDLVFTPNTGTTGSPLAVATTSLPSGTVSASYSQPLSASGGTSPYAWSLSSGSLPVGLALSSSGTISGTPTVAATSSFTAQVKDLTGTTASAPLGINIGTSALPMVSITTPANGSTITGTVNLTGSATDTLGIASVQVSIDGGSYANASGTTSWTFSVNTTALSNGTHSFSAKVTDPSGRTATSSLLDLNVNNDLLASDCTLYASPSGSSGNSGTSPSSPKSFSGAASATGPGSVVCLLGGTYSFSSTFSPPVSGTPSSWIVYKAYGDSPVNINYTGAPDGQVMFRFNGGSFPSNPAYLEFRNLNLNGQGNALDGFYCSGSHHLRFIGNSVSNTGGSGVSTIHCDYITADHNLVSHNGYIPSNASNVSWWSWTSGISLNSSQWFDTYSGLHNIISNNTVVGEFDNTSNHTDGNGIILDLGGNTPPTLILNNVVYGNGGRCIQPNYVQNFYVINNTCYKNDLDPNEPNFPSFGTNGASNGYIVNNIAYAWNSGYPAYGQYNGSSNIFFYTNLLFGASYNFSYSDPSQFILADPLFVSAPSLTQGGYSSAMPASQLGTALTLLPLSPAYSRGIDPSTLSGMASAIVSDLKKYIYTDINGKARPQGGSVDLGAPTSTKAEK